MERQDENGNNDSGNVGGARNIAHDNNVNDDASKTSRLQMNQQAQIVNSECQHTGVDISDQSRQQSSKRELNSQGDDDVFPCKKRLERNSPFSMYSDDSSSFVIQDDNVEKETNHGNPHTNKPEFTPGDDYIPIYSRDHREIFSNLMRDDASFDSRSVSKVYLSSSSQAQTNATSDITAQQVNMKTNNDHVQTEAAGIHRLAHSSKTTDNVSKQIPIDLLCQVLSAKRDECNDVLVQTPEMIPKAMFDKLAREVVKIKKDNSILRGQNHQLLHAHREMLQQDKMHQTQKTDADKMNEMHVELPPDRDLIKKSSVRTSLGVGVYSEERDLDDMSQPASIDVQNAKEMEGLATGGHPTSDSLGHPVEYGGSHSYQRGTELEIHLANEIEELKETLRQAREKYEVTSSTHNAIQESHRNNLQRAESLLNEERQRCENLSSILKDERSRFDRDISHLRKKIESLRAKLKNQQKVQL